jgi:pimeloyl-ACP methyl ester carboxylesterase
MRDSSRYTRGLLPLLLLLAVAGAALAGDDRVVTVAHGDLTLTGKLRTAGDWPDGPTLLITHGTLSHFGSEIITTLQTLLAEREISSLAVNLSLGLDRRDGPYPCEHPHRHRHEDALAELQAWRDWLRATGVSDITLLGHSRGGNQVAWYAAEQPGAVSRLILLAPPAHPPPDSADNHAAVPADPRAMLDQARQLVADGRGDTLLPRMDFLYCPDSSVSAASLVSYYGGDPRLDTPHLLPRIQEPVLVVIGTEDEVAPHLEARIRALPPMANLELAPIDGADHFFRGFFAEELVDDIEAFLP